jgi:predicted Zn-ribbon and HTH transcriptional regulator
MNKHTIEAMQKLATARGGKCLSKTYLDSRSKLTWQCKHGHQWDSAPDNIMRRSWCPTCGRSKKGTIEQMHNMAAQRGGKCLSKTYLNAHANLTWQCKDGHQWQAAPGNITRGNWCPRCRENTIEDMQALASSRGGKCLSKTYLKKPSKLTWQCKEGHQWDATPNNIQKGSWCPRCARR